MNSIDDTSLVCLVSGGARGLGWAIIEALLDDNHRVATFDIKTPPTLTMEKHVDNERFMFCQVDANDLQGVKKFSLAVSKHFGRLDALVNNAGMAVEGLLAVAPPRQIRRAIQLNLESVIWLTQVCSKIMLRQHGGRIVNISSINALRGFRGLAAYSATKAALDGFTRSLSVELGPRGILVNSVAPGFMETEMTRAMSPKVRAQIVERTPLGRLATVQEVAAVVSFLLSPKATAISGQTIAVDGGLSSV